MSARALGIGAIVTLAALTAGCGRSVAEVESKSGRVATESAPSCRALGALVDLERAMSTSPSTDNALVSQLVDAQEELGYARAAKERLATASTEQPLRASVDRLVQLLEQRSLRLVEATKHARDSYAVAETALTEASTCRRVDLRKVDAESDEPAKAADLTMARSTACAGTVRLWASTRNVDLTSAVSTAAVATQLAELGLDKERAATRDRLASALGAHATRLRELRKAASLDGAGAETRELVGLRAGLTEQVQQTFRQCLAPEPARAARRAASPTDPRSATVMVRPMWSGALKKLVGASQGGFGSGFVVRWTRADGRTEALIVTNRHVMEGSVEAEVLFAAELDAHANRNDTANLAPRTARLVAADESDDIAVLRIDGAAPTSGAGLVFRSDPPSEQEVVVAAGFPGIGMTPSFQVTKGVISNAHFGSEEQDTGIAYLQHTAPIDPGNSGGPLLDDGGRLVGMNTAKLHGRENVSLAIPAARIRFALRRAEEPRVKAASQAEVSCNVALEALGSEHPLRASMSRFGLSLFEKSQLKPSDGKSVVRTRRDRVVGDATGPFDDARGRVYEMLRETLDAERGVLPFETCSDVARVPGAQDSTPAKFTASFRTRSGSRYRATLIEEGNVMRLDEVTRTP